MISHNNVHVWRGCKVSQRGTEIGVQSLFERLSYPLLIITTSNIQNLSLKVGEIVSTSSFHPSNFEITLGSEIESIHSGFDYPRVSMILVWHVRELVCLFVCFAFLNFFSSPSPLFKHVNFRLKKTRATLCISFKTHFQDKSLKVWSKELSMKLFNMTKSSELSFPSHHPSHNIIHIHNNVLWD